MTGHDSEGQHRKPPIALEARNTTEDGRLYSPSAARNKDAVCTAFLDVFADGSRIVELASGTGEHGAHIVANTASVRWLYSDIDAASLRSQAAWRTRVSTERLLGPVPLNLLDDTPEAATEHGPFDGVFAANLLHIAPFRVGERLFAHAKGLLTEHGRIFVYGPFARDGNWVESNARFDQSLKHQDPAWGVRDLERELLPLAMQHGFVLDHTIDMPANNLSVVFRRADPPR